MEHWGEETVDFEEEVAKFETIESDKCPFCKQEIEEILSGIVLCPNCYEIIVAESISIIQTFKKEVKTPPTSGYTDNVILRNGKMYLKLKDD